MSHINPFGTLEGKTNVDILRLRFVSKMTQENYRPGIGTLYSLAGLTLS